MSKNYWSCLLCLLAALSGHRAQAQAKLPVVRATSTHVAIRDGGYLAKNFWTLTPQARPDVYTADRTREAKWVTFYTDRDSIRFRVKPGSHADFIILLNGQDSCYTRVASALPATLARPVSPAAPDTIPFTLTAEDAIAVRAILNQQDTLLLHFDTGSIEVRLTRETIRNKTHLLADQPTGASAAPPNYNKLRPVTSLQLGTLTLPTPPVMATGLTATGMDGRFGYALFEGKQVAIDYDHRRLLVYSSGLPRRARRGYARTKLVFRRSFVCVRGAFHLAGKAYAGDFLLDTGTNQAVIVDSTWASQQQFPRTLPLLKTIVLRDPRGAKYETRVVRAPAFSLAQFQAADVPTNLLSFAQPTRFAINYVGGGLLKRFNLIFDFAHDVLYLQPNQQWGRPFREPT